MNILFMGTPQFAVPALEALLQEGYHVAGVVTQPDRPKGRKKILTSPPVKEVAIRYGLPVFQPEKLRISSELEEMKKLQPDLVVTAAYGQLLPKELLELPRLGCINIHASLLPRYRGGAPIHQAIIDGEKETGITIMYMVEKLDAGDILSQARLPIEEDDDVASLFEKLSSLGASLLVETLPKLMAGEIKPIRQNEAEVTYAPNIKREDEEIEWQKPGQNIYDQIRGLHPFPGAFTTVNGEVVKIWSAKKGRDQLKEKVQPGQVLRLDQVGIGVAAGDQTEILITELQPSGKKRMKAADFLRGAGSNWFTGLKLGE